MNAFTGTGAWTRFLSGAAYVRAHPRFDPEERDRGLEVAQRAREVLEAARQGVSLRPSLGALSFCLSHPDRRYPLIPARAYNEWVEGWVSNDEGSLRRALLGFLENNRSAEERFARFAEAAEDAPSGAVIEDPPRLVLLFGSLFNFGLEPTSLPIVRRYSFEHLQRILGYDPKRESAIAEQYENHLVFARQLRAGMQRDGIQVRDMLDVQGLIYMSTVEEFWAPEPPRDQPEAGEFRRAHTAETSGDGRPYVSVCACLGFDAPYLLEWIEFHRLVGVERFFLYNNGDREAQRQLLVPYMNDGIVVLHDWPQFPPLLTAYRHCLREHREDSRWIAFIDTDEFLFSPTSRPLTKVLTEYEAWPGIGVNQAFFGTSGHRTKPPGLVIENYVQRIVSWYIKSIVNPAVVADCLTPHRFSYLRGSVVDENFEPIRGARTIYVSFSRLRINHYNTKSEQEFRAKFERRQSDDATWREDSNFDRIVNLVTRFGKTDHAILEYLPEVRDAVEQAASRIQAA